MNYQVEELLPIVADLTDKYTSKESTSVSYAKARQLMEAVLYCINQCEGENLLVSSKKIDAIDAYKCGCERLIEKVKKTQDDYNEMIVDFCAYGNKNYNDTVTKAIPGFFKYYDVKFAPQETIITMDYPTICPVINKTGIDAIQLYVEYISYEQKFMNELPKGYVHDILYRFEPDFERHFFNICNIILRHILGHMLIGKGFGMNSLKEYDENYNLLKNLILESDNSNIENRLLTCLNNLIIEKFDYDVELENYLKSDLKNFITELRIAAENDCIERVVVL